MKKVFYRLTSALLLLSVFVSIVPTASAAMPFTDVPSTSNYYEAIEYCYDHGIMNGTTSTTFAPTTALSRAMFVTVLYRMSGSSMQRAPTGFTDVPSGAYYYYAVGWAQYYGIVNGVSSTSFEPNTNVTREQAITILYRYATSYKGYSYNLLSSSYASTLNDYSSISSYARTAVNWALNCGIVSETTSYFYPKSLTLRQLCAEYLFRYLTKVQGRGKAYSIRSLSPGTASDIAWHISSMGYSTCTGYDLTAREMKFALRNSTVLFSHSHGNTNLIQMENGNVYSSDISTNSLYNMDLVYISACYAGNEFAPRLHDIGGAKAAVGFLDEVSASSDSDGIHYYNLMFFYYLKMGYDLEACKQNAYDDLIYIYNYDYGTDSCRIYQ